MQMAPQSIVPFFRARTVRGASRKQESAKWAAINTPPTHANGQHPLKLDVGTAVELLLSAHRVDGDLIRQKYHLDILSAVPADTIDWDTVDWVQVWPFKTTRQKDQ